MNKNWTISFNFQKHSNPQAAMMMGGSPLEWSIGQEYIIDKNTDIGLELNSIGIKSIITYRLNKYLALQANLEVGHVNPFAKGPGKSNVNKSFFRKFGVGLKFDSKDPQELFNPPTEAEDENLRDYEI